MLTQSLKDTKWNKDLCVLVSLCEFFMVKIHI